MKNLLIILSVLLVVVDGFQKYKEDQTKKIYLKPLKRLLKDFYPGGNAKLKIIFQRKDFIPEIRWFMNVSDYYLPHAEIANALNVDGKIGYSTRTVRSHDITAVTLNIKNFKERFPITITTVFNYKTALYQYQLKTYIPREIRFQLDILDSIIWLTTPPDTIAFSQSGDLHVKCEALIEANQSQRKPSGEIRIYRNSLDKNKLRWVKSKLENPSVARMNYDRKDNETSSTDHGKYETKGWKWAEIKTDYFNSSRIFITLSTSYKISNGTANDVCVYTCATDHANENEQTFYSAWVTNTSPKPPVMMLMPCEENVLQYREVEHGKYIQGYGGRNRFIQNDYNMHRNKHGKESYYHLIINITRNRPTCVRCRSFDSIKSPIHLQKGGRDLTDSTKTTIIDNHMNVPDGALGELTLTFLNPSLEDVGIYRCISMASLTDKEHYVVFEIRLR